MALIKCERCGGQVSDSAPSCPHCGFEFSERQAKQEASKEYTRLIEQERTNLRKEYDAIYTGYTETEKKEKIRNILYVLFVGITFLGMGGIVGFERLYSSGKQGPWMMLIILSFVLFIAGFIGSWAGYFLQKKTKREIMRELKKFQAWLENEKQLTYHVVLSEKEKVIFDSINI